jgi:hypothetical protein
MSSIVNTSGTASRPGTPAAGAGGVRNGLGTAGLVVGILAVITCWTVVGGVVLGVLAIIFGAVGRSRANRGEASNGGVAVAGIVLGLVGLELAIALIALGATFVFHHKKAINNLESCDKNATTQAQKNRCSQQFSNSVNGQS